MRNVLSKEQMCHCDRAESELFGMPSEVLMERAALAVVKNIRSCFPEARNICVIAGSGNNGGDGFAAARLLLLSGIHADVLFVGNHAKRTEQTLLEETVFENYGGTVFDSEADLSRYDLLVDALFGIGLSRPVIGRYADVIRAINLSPLPVVAVDIPSGISADSGEVLGCAVRADVTVTFAFEKPGHCLYPGADFCGRTVVEDVGISDRGLWRALPDGSTVDSSPWMIPEADDLRLLPVRQDNSNKGSFGKVLIVGGAQNMAGAAILSGRCAYRSGCGLVCLSSAEANRVILQTALPEAIFESWPEAEQAKADQPGDRQPDALLSRLSWADAVAAGPGLGQSSQAKSLLQGILDQWEGPLVLDADALNLCADDPALLDLMAEIPGRILTPHPGEMARLCRKTAAEVLSDPVGSARELAAGYSCIVVLKGACTVITDGGDDTALCPMPNSGLATGGSGDCLTGIIVSLLAQGMEPFNAAVLGVYIHALAGRKAREAHGSRSLIAGDLPEYLSEVLRET